MPGATEADQSTSVGGGASVGGAPAPRSPPVSVVSITVNGVPLPDGGTIEQGVAMAPADALVPAMGGSIVHAPQTSVARIFLGGHVVTAVAEQPSVEVDGLLRPIPVAPRLIGGELYIPVRAVVTDTGYAFRWLAQGGTVAVDTQATALPHLSAPVAAADLRVGTPVDSAAHSIPYTAEDLNLMARVVHGEADGEPLNARIGVAAVIVNRVRDPGWPKTIQGVIYAPGQFQAVGYPLFEQGPASEDVQAALAALHGQDPTGGAQFFYDPAQTWRGSWIFTRHTLVTIGDFNFAG